jgi:hypothetical protein
MQRKEGNKVKGRKTGGEMNERVESRRRNKTRCIVLSKTVVCCDLRYHKFRCVYNIFYP